MKLPSTTAIILFASTTLSLAAVDTTTLVSGLQARGYTSIEVKSGLTQVKVEAIRGVEKVETIYDRQTGSVLKRETGPVDANEDLRSGVSIRTLDRDFLRVGNVGAADDLDDDLYDDVDDEDESDDDAVDADDADDSDDGDDDSSGNDHDSDHSRDDGAGDNDSGSDND